MLRGYEAARLKGTNLAPAYNAGFYGHGLKNRLQMLEIALRLDRSVETAVIEVFTMDVMHDLRAFWQTPLSSASGHGVVCIAILVDAGPRRQLVGPRGKRGLGKVTIRSGPQRRRPDDASNPAGRGCYQLQHVPTEGAAQS